MYIEVDMRVLNTVLAPRLDRIFQLDLVGIAALDVNVAHAETHVQVTAGDEIAGIRVRLLVSPIVRAAQRNRNQAQQDDLVKRLNHRPVEHGTPRKRTALLHATQGTAQEFRK